MQKRSTLPGESRLGPSNALMYLIILEYIIIHQKSVGEEPEVAKENKMLQ